MADIDLSMKKKKKKKVTLEEMEGGAKPEEADAADGAAPAAVDASTLDFGKKKKSKKPKAPLDIETDGTVAAQTSTKPIAGEDLPDYPNWPDWTYDELITRAMKIINEKNPQLGEKKRFVMKPPQASRVGTKKTAFTNFTEICKSLKRDPKHVMQYLLAEMGTSGSVDGTSQLILKGKFQVKHFEEVLRKYIKEYLLCHTCKSPDTEMLKEGRLYFLQCKTCGSRCSVTAIKTGFQAVTGKRRKLREAAGK